MRLRTLQNARTRHETQKLHFDGASIDKSGRKLPFSIILYEFVYYLQIVVWTEDRTAEKLQAFGNDVQDMKLEQAFGQAVRFRRKAIGLNQEALAERAGLQTAAVSRVERGDGSPNLRTIERIATALNVRVSQLLLQAETLLPVMESAALSDNEPTSKAK